MKAAPSMTVATLVAARAVRGIGFGVLSVTLALAFAADGVGTTGVGLLLSVALLAGAAFSAFADRLALRYSRRTALLGGAAVMVGSGLLLASSSQPLGAVLACLLGTLSAGGQEVGPFSPVEQHALADIVPAAKLTGVLAWYNLAGALALAVGALAAAAIPTSAVGLAYAAIAVALGAVYATLNIDDRVPPHRADGPRGRGSAAVVRLTSLFGLDALAGGFVVQSFIAYWLHVRFGADQSSLAVVLFGANALAALSSFVAVPMAGRIGLVNTMVFTHLPSNVLLCLVPLMPTYPSAVAVLLARFAISQMDVPTRQAFTMSIVAPDERGRAAALTSAVRPTAAAFAPVLAGVAMASPVIGLPFFAAGGLKIVYDLAILAMFGGSRSSAAPREEPEGAER